jgi:hypothetical protein
MNADDVKEVLLPLELQVKAIKLQCSHMRADGSSAAKGVLWDTLFFCDGCREEILTPERKARLEGNIL